MAERIPSFFIAVPGPWQTPEALVDALRAGGIEARPEGEDPLVAGEVRVQVFEDDDLGPDFSWGRNGPLPPALVDEVAACEHVAVLELGWRLDQDPSRLARIGRALQGCDGVAVRMEGSGAASAWAPWLEHLESGEMWRVYAASVVVVADDDCLFTCGMQQFDLPDAELAGMPNEEAVAWLDELNVFQLLESPVLGSGHTFGIDAESPRRTLERWPDHRHGPEDGRHNPFGLWRLLPPERARLSASNVVPTIMPSLVALLTSVEAQKGEPLTRGEVQRIVADSPAVVMELADVMKLERSRGYADIEPELAWEQWQLIRGD